MPATAATSKRQKPVFRTARPFAETHCPSISAKSQQLVLDLVCDLLQPIGEHRKTHIQPSRGRKRKRNARGIEKKEGSSPDVDARDAVPPAPEIKNHILIGLNSVTRRLESAAAQRRPSTLDTTRAENEETPASSDGQSSIKGRDGGQKPLAVVLVTQNYPLSSPAHSHLPTLVALSQIDPLSHPKEPKKPSVPSAVDVPNIPRPPDSSTRLVVLPASSERRLADALHVPRVGAIGIEEDTPGALGLVEWVRENVDKVDCVWIEDAVHAAWKGLKVDVQMPGNGMGMT